jgi:CcmD family protein
MRAPIPLLMAIALLLATTQPALAAPLAQVDAPGESNLGFLFAGFAVVWLAFFAYAFYMNQRQREMRREIDELRQQLERRQQDS